MQIIKTQTLKFYKNKKYKLLLEKQLREDSYHIPSQKIIFSIRIICHEMETHMSYRNFKESFKDYLTILKNMKEICYE